MAVNHFLDQGLGTSGGYKAIEDVSWVPGATPTRLQIGTSFFVTDTTVGMTYSAINKPNGTTFDATSVYFKAAGIAETIGITYAGWTFPNVGVKATDATGATDAAYFTMQIMSVGQSAPLYPDVTTAYYGKTDYANGDHLKLGSTSGSDTAITGTDADGNLAGYRVVQPSNHPSLPISIGQTTGYLYVNDATQLVAGTAEYKIEAYDTNGYQKVAKVTIIIDQGVAGGFLLLIGGGLTNPLLPDEEMTMIKPLYLDLFPTDIPFVIQCVKADGTKIDPTAQSLIIYEETGSDTTFDSTQISGSPFTPSSINSKTGLYGKLIAKSAFTAGKFYTALWEMTIDGKTTARSEVYFACNASDFKATGFLTDKTGYYLAASQTFGMTGNITGNLLGYVSGSVGSVAVVSDKVGYSLGAAYDRAKTALAVSEFTAAPSVSAIRVEMDANSSKLGNLDAAVSTRLASSAYTAAPSVAQIVSGIDASSSMLATISDVVDTIAERTDNLPDDPAGATQLTAIQNTVNGISNVTRLSVALPSYIKIPDLADEAVQIMLALKDTSGNMEDADNNIVAVNITNALGVSQNALLYQDSTLTTPLTTISGGIFDGYRQLVRTGTGIYQFFYKITASETDGERLLMFVWEENSVALYEFRATQVSLATSDLTSLSNDVTTLLGRLTESRGDRIDYLDYPISDIPTGVWTFTSGRSLTDTANFSLGAAYDRAKNALAYTEYTAAPSSATIASDVWASGSRSLTDRTGYSLSVTPPTAVQIRQEMDANSLKLDATVSSRLASTGYTAAPSVIEIRNGLMSDFASVESNIRGTAGDTLQTLSDQIDGISTGGSFSTEGLALQSTLLDVKARTDYALTSGANLSLGQNQAFDVTGNRIGYVSGSVGSVLNPDSLRSSILPDFDDVKASILTSGLNSLQTISGGLTAISTQIYDSEAVITLGISTSETNIRGTAGDTLKGLSDKMDGLSGGDIILMTQGLAMQASVEEILASFGVVNEMVWANSDGERSLTTEVSASAVSVHDALDTWTHPTTAPNPPIIIPPADSTDCRVYAWIGGQSAAVTLGSVVGTAKIIDLPFVSNSRFHSGQTIGGSYDSTSGIIYWDIVRGASINISIPAISPNIRVTIPDSDSYDIASAV